LSQTLADRGWSLVIDGRDGQALRVAGRELAARTVAGTAVRAVPGDVSDAAHRETLLATVREFGRLDLLVNNASLLGPSPQPALSAYPLDVLEQVYRVNTVAPLALVQLALPLLEESKGRVINITSDAAVEAYEGWGGYGSSKAALEQLTRILAVEHPALLIYLADPGDLRTQMHQDAFPGEDISDRPPPEVAVPGLLELVEGTWPSGRYRAQAIGAAA
jgi:NAD(P)-dependent dehydrogenase (short-subunit alcohol dehydrogenase family)